VKLHIVWRFRKHKLLPPLQSSKGQLYLLHTHCRQQCDSRHIIHSRAVCIDGKPRENHYASLAAGFKTIQAFRNSTTTAASINRRYLMCVPAVFIRNIHYSILHATQSSEIKAIRQSFEIHAVFTSYEAI
jgi:hypothetical protein